MVKVKLAGDRSSVNVYVPFNVMLHCAEFKVLVGVVICRQ